MYSFCQGHLELPFLSYKVTRGRPCGAGREPRQGACGADSGLVGVGRGRLLPVAALGPASDLWCTVSSFVGLRLLPAHRGL